MTLTPLYTPKDRPMRLAIAMSGTGSNAKRIIELHIKDRDEGKVSFEPTLIFTDNPKSNAFKIAHEDYKDKGFVVPSLCNPIRSFYEKRGHTDLTDRFVREDYDKQQCLIFRDFGIDSIALAGYDWVTSALICNNFLTVNVHPGDLRVKQDNGKPKYIGLGWIPSAKAILNGESNVHTSIHLVTEELDNGPVLAVSAPQKVPDEVLRLEDRAVLLGEAKSISEISRFIRKNPDIPDSELSSKFQIYKFAKECQERLKVHGDWIIFPKVIKDMSKGKYSRDYDRKIYYNMQKAPVIF